VSSQASLKKGGRKPCAGWVVAVMKALLPAIELVATMCDMLC
jgi:hypothetical protein